MGKLTALGVNRQNKPGMYGDGDGLWLRVGKGKSWAFRFMVQGRAREMGLGAYPLVSLAEARQAAVIARQMIQKGEDPIDARGKARKPVQVFTFAEVATQYISSHEKSWSSLIHRQNWRKSLDTYVIPVFGQLPVDKIEVGQVMQVIDPLWQKIPVAANRVRNRIELVLDYATARGWRKGENPARWRGHLENLLPTKEKVRKVEHYAALSWQEIGKLVLKIREQGSPSSLGLEFLILTACRKAEVTEAPWSEIDIKGRMWVIPAGRMKARIEHRIPLCDRALEILREVPRESGWVFPGGARERPLSPMSFTRVLDRAGYGNVTVHGFRSTFRDWVAEATSFQRELAESALAHRLKDGAEAAYQRGDMMDKRRILMDEWAKFIIRK